ncbi:MAG: MBL fold metallo-hydrolase, partial [Candidatus Thorarchaeota archaeon]
MKILTIKSEGLASLSYFAFSEDQAIVIDPRRDVQVYMDLEKQFGVSITYIFDTHRHEDYVSGVLELKQHALLAKMGHSKETDFRFGDLRLKDGDTFQVGQMEVKCIYTPGHTDDSLCFLFSDISVGPDPIVVFTGDTLFVNEVGRTDLVDIQKHELMSIKLFHTLHDKILPLDDGVIVYPGHGAGSVCGGQIASRDFSTIGYERKNNLWLSLGEEDFVKRRVEQKLTRAPYFKTCERLNTIGPRVIDAISEPEILTPYEVAGWMSSSTSFAIDTRTTADFTSGHIPNSVNITLESLGQIAGWILEYTDNLFLILEDMNDLNHVRNLLLRLGLDNVRGVLA